MKRITILCPDDNKCQVCPDKSHSLDCCKTHCEECLAECNEGNPTVYAHTIYRRGTSYRD